MAGKVDVLAVLITASSLAERLGYDDFEAKCGEARAAVAELIEAAREASGTLGHIYHTTPMRHDLEHHAHDCYQRLDTALASVK